MKRALPILALAMVAITGCAPADVPRQADTNWSVIDGWSWTWQRSTDGACITWLATEDWADARLFPAEDCADRGGQQSQPSVGYFSVTDEVVFRGYWPWSAEIHRDLIVFDNQGMIDHVLPCPYQLEQTQIAELRQAAVAIREVSRTDGELRMLDRMIAHLDAVDGEALSVMQWGCSHHFSDPNARSGRARIDPWDLPEAP